MEETKIIFNTPKKLSGKAYICSHPQLPENLNVMDGVISSNNMEKCAAIILNSSSTPIFLPKATNFASLQLCSENDLKPVSFVFAVRDKQVKLMDTSHLRKIDLSHVADRHLASYKSLLTEYADVFSKHDLDVGHCKALPHQVRLTDPNKIVSINQYRLPYHLKEVAIDYVKKLLKSGVVRPSTSCLLYTSPSPRDLSTSRMPSSA